MKTCNKCKIEKELTEFYERKARPGLFRATCKKCMNTYEQNRYKDNPKISQQATKNWKIKNREKHLEQKRQHEAERVKDKELYEKKLAYARAYSKNNPVKYKPAFQQGDNVMYQGYKYRVLSSVRGKGFSIRKYGLDDIIIVVPKKFLTPLKPKPLY